MIEEYYEEGLVQINKRVYLKLYDDSKILNKLLDQLDIVGLDSSELFYKSIDGFKPAIDCDDRGKITKWA